MRGAFPYVKKAVCLHEWSADLLSIRVNGRGG